MTNKKVAVPLAPPPPTPKKDFSARFAYRFSLPQLAEMFGFSLPTVKKRIGDIEPAPSAGRKAKVYDIADISELVDVRHNSAIKGTYDTHDKNEPVLLDENGKPLKEMSPTQMKLYYQGLDMEQSYRAKKLKNDTYERKMIPAEEIEKVQASAFKNVAKFLDNFPDIMERNGLVKKEHIPRIVVMTDKVRNQLADDMQQYDGGDPDEIEVTLEDISDIADAVEDDEE